MTATPIPTPAEILRLSVGTSAMLAEAQTVIALRLLGMVGLWPRLANEEMRMVSEKLAAAVEAQSAVLGAALGGASPVAMAEAALHPVRRRTQANVARLVGAALF